MICDHYLRKKIEILVKRLLFFITGFNMMKLPVKGALSGLRKLWVSESPFKMMKNAF